MFALIIAGIVGFLALSALGSWIGKRSAHRHWSGLRMLLVSLVLGGCLGYLYYSYVIIPLYNNI